MIKLQQQYSPWNYYRARYYNPGSGRFLSEDPIGFASGDYNEYRYVLNNPHLYKDPSGKILLSSILALAASPFIISSIIDVYNLTTQIVDYESRQEQIEIELNFLQSQNVVSCNNTGPNLIDNKIEILTAEKNQFDREIYKLRKRRNSSLASTIGTSIYDPLTSLILSIGGSF